MKPIPLAVTLAAILAVDATRLMADPLSDFRRKLDEQQQSLLNARKQADQQARQGWHWYKEEEPKEETTEEEPPAPPKPEQPKQESQPEKPKTVVIDNAWLRDNMPKLLDQAMDNPKDENKVALFWLVHRIATDKVTMFQDNTRRLYMNNPEFTASENARRPTSQFALQQRDAETEQGKLDAVKAVFERAGIWVFYRSDCQYCMKEAPVLKSLERSFGVNVLPISLDGMPLPGGEFPDYVTDTDFSRAQRLGVRKTPSIYLVTNDGSQIHMLSEGIITMPDLVDTILYVARKANIITEQELQKSRDVQQVYMTDDSGQMQVPQDWVDKHPEKLVEALKQRMDGIAAYGSAPAEVPTNDQQ